MRPELNTISEQLDAADERLRRLLDSTPEAHWTRPPEPGRWSIMECVDHLNRSTDAYRDLIADGLERARELPPHDPDRKYRRDFLGWLLCGVLKPPARFRSRTNPEFEPTVLAPSAELVERFHAGNDALRGWLRDADGLAIDEVKIPSPFVPSSRYSVYSAFAILAVHQHRHLWQAEQAAAALAAAPQPGGASTPPA